MSFMPKALAKKIKNILIKLTSVLISSKDIIFNSVYWYWIIFNFLNVKNIKLVSTHYVCLSIIFW